ncbi:class I SAM-dependent methyltransferase [Rhodoblastus sp.]|uniref:class I SAM-dependent methyltransferase n=1 Tax=Rhodoblastus sp. TaxID=1962975 RepID=UPI003F9A1349
MPVFQTRQAEAKMSDWGSGYITDAAYVHDFCRVQTPPMLSLAALAAGVEAPGGTGEPLVYCDLGCGQGFTANLIAAAQPQTRVCGYDFNPSHIANARALARDAGSENIEFVETGFAELAEDATTPEFDVIALHGVYSWIGAENRRAIVRFIARRLRPGGLVYISYDCMPGWAAFAPLRRIIARRFAPRPDLPSPKALEHALAYAAALIAADARYFRVFPNVETQLERLKKTPRAYLAHEILTGEWEAFAFGQVAQDMSAAKLTYLGSAYLADGVDRLNFTEAQRKMLAGLDDPVLAEETRDMMLSRQFRRDIFVKGRTPAAPARLRDLWLDRRFVLSKPAEEFDGSFETPLGRMQTRPEIHGPLIEALRLGAVRLRDLLEKSPSSGAHWSSLLDAVKLLVARGDIQPALPEQAVAAREKSVRAFNGAVLARAAESDEFRALASPATGSGVAVERLVLLYLLARRKGVDDPAAAIVRAAEKGASGVAAEAARVEAQKQAARVEHSIAPLLKMLRVD